MNPTGHLANLVVLSREKTQSVRDISAEHAEVDSFINSWVRVWRDYAFPVVEMSHKQASALMATNLTADIEVRAPWPCFVVSVPDRLLFVHDDSGTLQHIQFVCACERNGNWVLVFQAEGRVVIERSTTLRKLVEFQWGNEAMSPPAPNFDSIDSRSLKLASALVINVCLAMHDPASHARIGKHFVPSEGRSGPPKVNVYRITAPVRVDCRSAVTDYVLGRKSSMPTVQWLVRGHWRNQSHGAGHTMRKLMWIEPYWKGDENAPIALRPHVLSGRDAQP